MARGNGGQIIFCGHNDYRKFKSLLWRAKQRFDFRLHAYCLMPNHFHMLIRVKHLPLSLIMQWILTCYAKYFNIHNDRHGHLFQNRFKALYCQDETYFLTLLRYIHRNPVRAGEVQDPGDWPWTGHRALIEPYRNGLVDTEFTLALFHSQAHKAREQYKEFAESGSTDSEPESALLGNCCFSMEQLSADRTEDISCTEKAVITDADPMIRQHILNTGFPLDVLRGASRARPIADARRNLIRSFVALGLRPGKIAVFLRCSPALISKALRQPIHAQT